MRLITCFERFNPLRFLKAYEQVRCNSPLWVMLCIFWCLCTYFWSSDLCIRLSAILNCSIHRCMLQSGYDCHSEGQIWRTCSQAAWSWAWFLKSHMRKPWNALGCSEFASCQSRLLSNDAENLVFNIKFGWCIEDNEQILLCNFLKLINSEKVDAHNIPVNRLDP